MTRDEYSKLDIIERIERAIEIIRWPNGEAGEDRAGDPTRDFIVWQDDGVAMHVTDVLHDAIISIKRLRAVTGKAEVARYACKSLVTLIDEALAQWPSNHSTS